MAQYDGSIRIGTGIETKTFKAGSKEIESEARHMAKTVSSSLGDSAKIALQKQTDAFIKQNQQYAQQKQKVESLRDKLKELSKQKIETTEFKEISKQIDSDKAKLNRLVQAQKTFLEVGGKTSSSAYKRRELEIEELRNSIKFAKGEQEELFQSNGAYQQVDTSKLIKDLESAEIKLKQMKDSLQTSADSLTLKTSGEAAEEERLAQIKANSTVSDQEKVDLLENRKRILEEIKDLEKAGVGGGYKEYEEALDKLERINQQLSGEAAEEERLAQIKANAVVGNKRIVEVAERRKQLLTEIKDMENAGIGAGYKQYDSAQKELAQINKEISTYMNNTKNTKSAYEKLANLAKSAFHSIGNAAKKAGKSISSHITSSLKKAAASMFGFGKSTKSTNSMLGKGFKTILKYGLGIRSFYILFNKFRTAVKDGFKNLAQFSGETNKSISTLKSALTQLKNSFATAFAPILDVIAPALTTFINLISKALNYLGMFIAALSGKSTFTKAVAVQEDYAKSLKNTSDSAKEAKKYLSGLDEVKTFTDDKNNSGKDNSSVKPSEMFETVPIESSIANLAEKIKDMIKNEDWEGIGAYLADGINNGLQKVYDILNWDNIEPKVTYFIDAFTGVFNSLVDKMDWDLIGHTIGAGVNTLVNTLNLLFTKIDFVNLGKKIAEGINGLADEVNFENLGELIGNKFMILPRILLGFVSNLNWSDIGISIGNALNGIVNRLNFSDIGELLGKTITGLFHAAIDFSKTFDWKKLGNNMAQGVNSTLKNTDWAAVGQGISDFVIGLLDALIEFIEETDWQAFGESIATMLENIDWGGVIGRLFEAIGAAIGGLAAFLWGLIKGAWDDVVDWWYDVAYEDGKFTIEGLLMGILEMCANIAEWGKEHIVDPFINGFKKAFGINSPSTVMQEQGNFIMQGLLNGITELIGSVVEKFTEIKNKIIGKWEEVKSGTKEKWNTIKSDLSNKWGNLKTKASSTFENIKKNISDKWTNIKANTNEKWNAIKSKLSGTWESLKSSANNSSGGIKETVVDAWERIKNSTSRIWDGIKDAIKTPINAIIGFINDMIGGICDGINSVIRMLNKFQIHIPNNPITGALDFGINIPEISAIKIPALATGTVIPPNIYHRRGCRECLS